LEALHKGGGGSKQLTSNPLYDHWVALLQSTTLFTVAGAVALFGAQEGLPVKLLTNVLVRHILIGITMTAEQLSCGWVK